jgi:hypothetical protein
VRRGGRKKNARHSFFFPSSRANQPLALTPAIHFPHSHTAGVTAAADHPTASAITLGTALLLALPLTRRAVWAATFGRFVSEEARTRAALSRAAAAADVVSSVRTAADKAGARAEAAIAEYERARAGMATAAAGLRALERQAAGAEREATAALEQLRGVRVPPAALAGPPAARPGTLPPPPALAARADAANAAAEARRLRRALADQVWGCAKFGF